MNVLTVYHGNMELETCGKSSLLVYSWSPETKLPVVRMMVNIGPKEEVETLEIEFDSGLKVNVPKYFQFLTFRGNEIKAEDLCEGQSVRAYTVEIHRDNHMRALGWADGKVKHQYVARMVWECFNGKIPPKMILHHVDFNELNNHIDNFKLVTHEEHNRIHYPFRKAKGFFKRNHKVISIKESGKVLMWGGEVEDTKTFIIPDITPISGTHTGIVAKSY